MLTLTVLGEEFFDETSQEFLTIGDFTLELEHSLVSLSKWEELYEKPFLGKDQKSDEETLGYIQAMCLTPNVPAAVWSRLSAENLLVINEYISAKKSATWFNDVSPQRRGGEVITAELIYYWMIALNIPFECQHWHLNKLFTLIKVCNLKQTPPKKMGRTTAAERQRQLNAARKAQYGTTG